MNMTHDDEEEFDIDAVLSSIDPTLEIEDPGDRRYFDEILARPRHEIKRAQAKWLKAVQERGGISFRKWYRMKNDTDEPTI